LNELTINVEELVGVLAAPIDPSPHDIRISEFGEHEKVGGLVGSALA